jgi:HAMP domain-containing protein
MKPKKIRFDGTGKDIKLWHTYVHWAKNYAESCHGAVRSEIRAIADDPANRVADDLAAALCTVLFASFMLEYRLRRVLDAMGVQLRRNTTLGPLLSCFWSRLGYVERLDGKGRCAAPAEWRRLVRPLTHLVELRNALAHGNYAKTVAAFGKKRRPGTAALKYYNAVVDAVRVINEGTGHDPDRTSAERRRYFEPLKVRHRRDERGYRRCASLIAPGPTPDGINR